MKFSTFVRNVFFSITTCAVGLSLLAASGNAQNTQSKVQKEKIMTATKAEQTKNDTTAAEAIRPFHISIPDERLKDLRRRIAATQWPEQELVSDASQGVQLATMKKLADYWAKLTTGGRPRRNSIRIRSSLRTSTVSTSISFTLSRKIRTHSRSSSRTDGPARSSSN